MSGEDWFWLVISAISIAALIVMARKDGML